MKTPIICTNSGGTHEILRGKRSPENLGIGKNGIVLDDVIYNYSVLEEEYAPKIPDKSVDYLLDNCELLKNSKSVIIDSDTHDISLCVDKYEKILSDSICLMKT